MDVGTAGGGPNGPAVAADTGFAVREARPVGGDGRRGGLEVDVRAYAVVHGPAVGNSAIREHAITGGRHRETRRVGRPHGCVVRRSAEQRQSGRRRIGGGRNGREILDVDTPRGGAQGPFVSRNAALGVGEARPVGGEAGERSLRIDVRGQPVTHRARHGRGGVNGESARAACDAGERVDCLGDVPGVRRPRAQRDGGREAEAGASGGAHQRAVDVDVHGRAGHSTSGERRLGAG